MLEFFIIIIVVHVDNYSDLYLIHSCTACATDAVAFSNAHFGAGTGTIYLDNVGCTGSETNLTSCPRSSSVYCYRGHSEDAGVRCQGLDYWKNDFFLE